MPELWLKLFFWTSRVKMAQDLERDMRSCIHAVRSDDEWGYSWVCKNHAFTCLAD